MTRPDVRAPETETALTRLLEAEARLEALLDHARLEAGTVTAEAEARAVAVTRAVDEELAMADGAAASGRSAAASARLRELALDRDSRLARLNRHGQARVEALAAWVTTCVIESVVEGGRMP
jgi:hypothetical protein